MSAARKKPERVGAKPVGKLHARMADLYEELANVHRELSFTDVEGESGKVPRARKAPERPLSERMTRLVPTELQAAKARQILRAKGLID